MEKECLSKWVEDNLSTDRGLRGEVEIVIVDQVWRSCGRNFRFVEKTKVKRGTGKEHSKILDTHKRMPLMDEPVEGAREAAPKQIDRPPTGRPLAHAPGLAKLVKNSHDAQPASQDDGVVCRTVMAPATVAAVDQAEDQHWL